MKTYVSVLILVCAIALPQAVHAERRAGIVPPVVPGDIALSPSDFTPFLAAHAVGTQGYFCVAAGSAFRWMPFGPQATLFDQDSAQVLTHFLGITPYSQELNPAWQHSRDSSIVWGHLITPSTDTDFVAADAIPWLLLEAVVVGDGPTGGDKLLPTRRIQRVNTVQGKAPSSGCSASEHIGTRALVPYEADYYFYKENAAND